MRFPRTALQHPPGPAGRPNRYGDKGAQDRALPHFVYAGGERGLTSAVPESLEEPTAASSIERWPGASSLRSPSSECPRPDIFQSHQRAVSGPFRTAHDLNRCQDGCSFYRAMPGARLIRNRTTYRSEKQPYMRALEFRIALGFAIATSAGLLWVIWLMLSGSFP